VCDQTEDALVRIIVATPLSKKVCLLGDFAVGKTSLVRRFVYNLFDDTYLSTIGVNVSRKSLLVPKNAEVVELTIILWDIAGNNGFQQVRTSYMRGAAAAIFVFDRTRAETLDSFASYHADLHSVSPNARIIFAANKSDLIHNQDDGLKRAATIATEFNAPCYTTSARTGDGVDALFRHLGRLLVG
jgi:small GTP-binding protein